MWEHDQESISLVACRVHCQIVSVYNTCPITDSYNFIRVCREADLGHKSPTFSVAQWGWLVNSGLHFLKLYS